MNGQSGSSKKLKETKDLNMTDLNRIPAIRNFDDARGRLSFSFTSKNTVIISIEKSDDNRNDNRQNVLSIYSILLNKYKKEDSRNNPH